MKKDIIFIWTIGHKGITGNIKADLAAKEALLKNDYEKRLGANMEKLRKTEQKSILPLIS
nr:unnamed protein product [Callosobruchus chinensis]